MNVLLINIPLRPSLPLKLFPVGLGYIATAMHNAGIEFDLLDLDANRMSDAEAKAQMAKKKYDVFCFGCLVTGYKYIKYWAEYIKGVFPDSKIVVGNSVATSIPEILLNNTKTDIAVMGEGDIAIVEILHAIETGRDLSKISGIWYRDGENVIKTGNRDQIKDISCLPHINFDLFDAEEYVSASKHTLHDVEIGDVPRALPISTARGCIANCTFCYHVFKGQKYRYRPPAEIAKELEGMVKKYNLNYVHFWDELTFFSKKQAKELAEAIIKSGVKVNWMARCRANLFSKDEDIEIINLMKQAGCHRVQYCIESSDESILKAMNKNITPEQFSKQTKLFRKAGINPITSLVLGYPQETPETIKSSVDFCIENGIYPSVGYLLPQPGSVMYGYAIDHGFIKNEEEYIMKMGDRQDLLVNMTTMTDEEFMGTVKRELDRCNLELKAGLEDNRLIKTYECHKKESE